MAHNTKGFGERLEEAGQERGRLCVGSNPHFSKRYGCGSMPTHRRPRSCPASSSRSPNPLVLWAMLKLLECAYLQVANAHSFDALDGRGYTLQVRALQELEHGPQH